jgi:hypothetical protein
MRFPFLRDARRTSEARRLAGESPAAGRSGEARAKAEGPRTFSPAAPVRFSAHRMSVVDGPFPETKQ